MNRSNLIIDLDVREDKNNNIYYIGRLKAPVSIDLNNGLTFLVFISDDGEEELQIALNDKESTTFSSIKKKKDRIGVNLDKRIDKHGKEFYVAKLLMNGYIRCHDEVVFMIFTSIEGAEEIQIVGDMIGVPKPIKHESGVRPVEVYKKRITSYG